ncbi:signal peptidase I [Candidatus Woesearchaeota archaeon]|nr:signal peptidase I [Candidatus Woesearchaeota archaeon]
MKRTNIQRTARRIWKFIWEEDSWASLFVNIILAFVIIKFIVYPGLGLILHTPYPIVAVVSGSMEHDGSFESWWSSKALCGQNSCSQAEHYQQAGIAKEDFQEFPYKNGFNIGDIMILYGTKPEDIRVGNVIVFRSSNTDPIIHRVIKIKEKSGEVFFTTKGDHNSASLAFESYIPEEVYLGRAVWRVPYLGYIKIVFVKLIGLFQLIV